MLRKKILSYWKIQLRDEAAALPSLKFFHAECMSLKKPHPIWLTAGSSPAKVRKATIQAVSLAGARNITHPSRFGPPGLSPS